MVDESKPDTVRFNLYLTREAYDALEKLRVLTGKKSLAETVRSALNLYRVVQEAAKQDRELFTSDRSTGECFKLTLVE